MKLTNYISILYLFLNILKYANSYEQYYVTKVFSMPIKISVNNFNLGYSTNSIYQSNSFFQSNSFYQSNSYFNTYSTNLWSWSTSQYSSFTQLSLDTIMPTLLPTQLPSNTIIPTIMPTYSPTLKPTTIMPTYSPTIMPTQSPTQSPTIMPTTKMPTLKPTIIPTLKPTNTPEPIKQIIKFETTGKLTGLTSPQLKDADKEAVIIATANSMNISYNFVKLTNYSIVSRRRLFNILTNNYNILYTTQINYPINNNNNNIQNTYNLLVNLLVNAVSNGAFNNYLQLASIALNATTVSSATISNISATSYSVITNTNSPTSMPTYNNKNKKKNINPFSISKDVFDFVLLLLLVGLPLTIYLFMPYFKRYYLKYKSKINLMAVTPYPIHNNNNNNKIKSYSLEESELTNILPQVQPVENVLLLDDELFEEIKRKTDELIIQMDKSILYSISNSNSSISSLSSLPIVVSDFSDSSSSSSNSI